MLDNPSSMVHHLSSKRGSPVDHRDSFECTAAVKCKRTFSRARFSCNPANFSTFAQKSSELFVDHCDTIEDLRYL